jgi:hypothetical protein
MLTGERNQYVDEMDMVGGNIGRKYLRKAMITS